MRIQVLLYGIYDLSSPEAGSFQEGSHQMAPFGVGVHSNQKTAGVVSPVGREDTLECGHEVYITTVCNGKSLRFDLGRISNQTNRLGPRDGSTCHFNGAFKRVLGLVANLVADCREEAGCRRDRLAAHVCQNKTAGSIGGLNFAWH